MRESLTAKRDRANHIYETLMAAFPNASTALTHKNAFELLVATVLSAQCTDERVNMVTPGLFEKFPTPQALADGNLDAIKSTIKSINFFNNKAINIKKLGQQLIDNHEGVVPDSRDELVKLAGVGRKTANVVLGVWFDQPGITVDTHVNRLSQRLKFTTTSEPVKAEFQLMKVWKDEWWTDFSTILILHGRQTCKARKPDCETCVIGRWCPSNLTPKIASRHSPTN